ncbi:hypothetical protein FB45DRAFT_428357 [Roridomyces roridus]|uniref:Uncharacterized protein n=1 Tax=Roridomyces roridus TaxID=1738132 RepID=A0AAD7C617_9AGAR|nr:hypothetical protein FB45DRAFT_428357 [Roridomyces roridus]
MVSILSRAADGLHSFLYSSTWRVYIFRLLLFSNAVALGLMIHFDLAPYDVAYKIVDLDHWAEHWQSRLFMITAVHVVVLVHHLFVVLAALTSIREFNSRIAGVLDIALTAVELTLLLIFQVFVFQITINSDDRVDLVYLLGYMPFIYAGFSTVVLICLALSLVFRFASAVRSRWGFFGGCTSTLYNIQTVFMNRSVTRPLIRGESPFIIAPRALVINWIVVGVAGFAVYSIVLSPLESQVYVRTVAGTQLGRQSTPSNQEILTGNLRYMIVNH